MAASENTVRITDQTLDVTRVTRVIPNRQGGEDNTPLSYTLVKDSAQDDTVGGRALAEKPGVGEHRDDKAGAVPGFMGNRDDYTLEQLRSSGFIRVWQRLHPEDITFPAAKTAARESEGAS